jgi:tRNA nucleotidyltransferase (CCA-adding enzyme)
VNPNRLTGFLQDNLPFALDHLPSDCYLVGGAVRDVLLQRHQDYLDLDFVLPHKAVAIAQKIARDYQGSFVLLDQERKIARVVFPGATIDFAQQEGETLRQDLGRRDYTINAIAFNCHTGAIIDPFQGQTDLEQQRIRMVSASNLEDDPLRLLRAYRQASQLDFRIEAETKTTLRKLAPRLSQVAAERINREFSYLLRSREGSYWLQEAYRDGILAVCFANVEAKKISYLVKIDSYVDLIRQKWTHFPEFNSDWLYLAKLSLLTSANPEMAQRELIKLKYSRHEIQGVVTILKGLSELLNTDNNWSLRKQYFFFLAVGKFFPSLALIAFAYEVEQELINLLISSYVEQNNLVAHLQPLVNGNDLMRELQLKPSPLIGELLTEIAIARIEGKINTSLEALQWAQTYLASR